MGCRVDPLILSLTHALLFVLRLYRLLVVFVVLAGPAEEAATRLVQRENRVNMEVERSCKALAEERDERVGGVGAVKVGWFFFSVSLVLVSVLLVIRNSVGVGVLVVLVFGSLVLFFRLPDVLLARRRRYAAVKPILFWRSDASRLVSPAHRHCRWYSIVSSIHQEFIRPNVTTVTLHGVLFVRLLLPPHPRPVSSKSDLSIIGWTMNHKHSSGERPCLPPPPPCFGGFGFVLLDRERRVADAHRKKYAFTQILPTAWTRARVVRQNSVATVSAPLLVTATLAMV